jgi:hypothetical protein
VTIKGSLWSIERYRYRFRNPYKEESLPNAQLQFGEKRILTFPIPKSIREAQIRLVYRLMHRWEGSGAETIHEATVNLAR